MKKIILIALTLASCSDIKQPIVLKSNKIIGCNCNDGTYQVWRRDLVVETINITQFPCAANGGIKSYVYN